MDVEKDLKGYIVSKFMHGEADNLRDDESLFETGTIDSLGVLQLVAFLEERFGVHVEDEELVPENFETINKLMEFIEGKLALAQKQRR